MFQDTDRFVEDIAKLRRCTLTHSDCTMSTEEQESFLALLALRSRLECDLLGISLNQSGWRRAVLGCTILDVKAYFQDWKVFERAILARLEDEGELEYEYFKRTLSSVVHYKWIVTSSRPFFSIEDSVSRVRLLRQWTTFDSRYLIESVDNRDSLISDYLQDERLLRSLAYPDVSLENQIVREWCSHLVPCEENIIPHHGPGATANLPRSATVADKYADLSLDAGLIDFCQHLWRDVDEVYPVGASSKFLFPLPTRFDLIRTCKLVFVPKTALTKRVISKEPTALQWSQQVVFHLFDDLFRKVPTCRIDLHRPEISGRMALRGSIDGSIGTIDLSKASDYVTLSLVRELFRGTDFLPLLELTRSTNVDLGNGEQIQLAKFAPMGSSCCFPVECVVFASICEATIRRLTGRPSRPGMYQVYGDDIAIEARFATAVVDRLRDLHFVVNRDKSFYSSASRFREACGVEAYGGEDISPLRIPRGIGAFPPIQSECGKSVSIGLSKLAGWVDFVNQLYLYGFRETRKCVLALLQQDKRVASFYRIELTDYRRFGSPAMPFIITDDLTGTQYRVKTRWNRSLFQREARVLVFATASAPANEPIDLVHWHVSRRRTLVPPKQRFAATTVRPSTKLKWKWVRLF